VTARLFAYEHPKPNGVDCHRIKIAAELRAGSARKTDHTRAGYFSPKLFSQTVRFGGSNRWADNGRYSAILELSNLCLDCWVFGRERSEVTRPEEH
jgi:hypothetical protein